MDNARNNINILSSDVVIACGYGGSGTASEIALALKSGKPVILLNERRECIDFFRAISGKLVHESNSVDDTISHVKKLLEKRSKSARCLLCANSGHSDIHSMSSSARCCKINGTDRPSALAVFRLMTISYLVGVCTGRSAGFSPLRMRST